jgi:predicted N-acetyltransferase YhbS
MSKLPPITPESPEDHEAVDWLVDQAFGPGRYAKAAERLREGNAPDLSLSVVARDGGQVVGCARMWPVKIGETAAMLLGPFAVAESMRGKGLGQALAEDACARARAAGHRLVVLVGDAPYFERMGFIRAPAEVKLPGPVDTRRVLILPLQEGAAEGLSGMLSRP